MRMEIEQHPNPVTITQEFEAELADAGSRNTEGTGELSRTKVNASVPSRSSTARNTTPTSSASYLGHTRKGYEYKVITNAEGHELLSTAADISRTNHRNRQVRLSLRSGAAAGSDSSSTPPLPIPEWAIDPSTPMDQRPRSGFATLGPCPARAAQLEPGFMLLPGETLPQARTRQRAARLHQLLLDSIRILATGTANNTDPDGGPMPMKPHFTLAVTIDYQSLTGPGKCWLHRPRPRPLRDRMSTPGLQRRYPSGHTQRDGVPLELGRSKRYFNRAQRRAIAVRDKGCCNPGCSMAVNRTEAHHLDEWSAGGNTDVSRGCLLCVRCHTTTPGTSASS